MKRNTTSRLSLLATQCLLGGIAVAAVTFVFFRLKVGLATASLVYLAIIAALSLFGSFAASLVLSLAAAACLNYFFASPLLSIHLNDPKDVLAIAAFLASAFVVSGLSARLLHRDVEDRRRAAEVLRESEAHWKEVFEHNPVMYFVVDADGTVLSVNGFGAAQLGYSVDDLVGQSVLSVFFEEDRAFVRKNLAQCVGNPGQANGWEVRKIRKDGTVLWVRENAKAVRQAENQLIVLVACEDITERKRAEDALNLARVELARVTRVTAMGELTAAIAHEVSQPLTGLVSSGNACLRWLGGDPPNLEAARRAVERMVNDGRRAGEVIRRLRAMARKSAPRRDRLSINDVIREVIALIGGEVRRHDITLRTELAPDLPRVPADRIQLQQVLLNLIVNAMEAMSRPDHRHRELSITSTRDGADRVLVAVRDSGPGLDRASPDQLFEAFYTTKADGMGMGLAISRTIIEAHRGRLWATPNLPSGAEFRFTLPTEPDEVS